jgi:cell division septation protein DedD
MITIKPSTDDDNPRLPPEGSAEELKKRIPMVWIPATLVVGLLIAAIYLGGRIAKARPNVKPEVVQLAKQAPVAPAVSAAPASVEPVAGSEPAPPTEPAKTSSTIESPATPTKSASAEPLTVVTADDGIPMITPQTGQRYIQVGALNHEATRRFVQHLRSEKLDPHVAEGPTPDLMRVLIGPFDDRDALNERKAQLETEGIDTFVREY